MSEFQREFVPFYQKYDFVKSTGMEGFLKELQQIPVGQRDFDRKVEELKAKYQIN